MEASAVAGRPPAGGSGILSPTLLRLASDAHLVALIRQGRTAAFEAAYDRHHRAIHSFCRHMLGQREEAEDVVQHTFLAAYSDITSSEKPIHLRAWLFTIARNRCYSILRARREQPAQEFDEPVTDGLAAQVQRRQDLRDLLRDMRRLPDDQRAALVLAELDALSHEEIAEVLGIPRQKVKALVFQARESLTASRAAREVDCSEIREQLAIVRGGGLRRGQLRRHLRECQGCRDFRSDVERQRRRLALMLPVAPAVALKDTVLATALGGGASLGIAGGGILASALKGGLIKSAIAALLAAVGAAGAVVTVQTLHSAQPARAPAPPSLAPAPKATLGHRAPSALPALPAGAVHHLSASLHVRVPHARPSHVIATRLPTPVWPAHHLRMHAALAHHAYHARGAAARGTAGHARHEHRARSGHSARAHAARARRSRTLARHARGVHATSRGRSARG